MNGSTDRIAETTNFLEMQLTFNDEDVASTHTYATSVAGAGLNAASFAI